MPRNATRRGPPKNSQVEQADKDRALYDWGKLPLQALRLKCNSYVLVEHGTKVILQQRLYAHFHPRNTPSISHPTSPPTADVSAEIAELRGLILDLQKQQTQNPPPVNQTIANSTVTDTLPMVRTHAAQKKSSPALQALTTSNSCTVDTESSDSEEVQPTMAPLLGFQHVQGITGIQGTSFNCNPTTNTHAPPAIPLKLLKKVQKGEYIDFALLLSAPHNLLLQATFLVWKWTMMQTSFLKPKYPRLK